MPLVAAKCTQCGANLEIDNANEAALCPYCHTPFVTERAINNYSTYNQNNYKIENAQVHINDEKSIENRLKNAEVFFEKHHDEEKAKKIFESVTDDAPDDYRGWWGLVRVYTSKFSYTSCGENIYLKVGSYAKKAFNVAPTEILEEIKETWEVYTAKYNTNVTQKLEEREKITECKAEAEVKYNKLQKQEKETSQLILRLKQRYNDKRDAASVPSFSWYIIIVFGGILGSAIINKYFVIIAYSILCILIVRIIFLKVTSKSVVNKYIVEKAKLEALKEESGNLYQIINQATNEIQLIDRLLA